MKLGITGLLPNKVEDIDAPAIRRVREMGFTGTALNIDDPPADISTARAAEIGKLFADEAIKGVEYGQYQTSFVDPDPNVRAVHIETVRQACRVAAAVGCPAVVVGIGSLNPAGQWFPHPENYAPATQERLISTLCDAVSVAEDAGVVLALECHVTVTLKNAQIARDVLDAVGSPALKIHLDPVNWMTFDSVYESGAAIAEMFSTLGPQRIQGAHSKGVKVENELIVHLNETYTGAPDDLLDHGAFLNELAGMLGDPYLVIEHLAVEHMSSARAHLLAVAERHNLRFTGQETGGAAC
jgi:sugar phosphate isomerase/epimerase